MLVKMIAQAAIAAALIGTGAAVYAQSTAPDAAAPQATAPESSAQAPADNGYLKPADRERNRDGYREAKERHESDDDHEDRRRHDDHH